MAPSTEEIRNQRTGQRMRFLSGQEDPGDVLRIETRIPPTANAEPLHVHPYQESEVRVVSGILHFEVDGALHVVAPGQRIEIDRGIPHRFWNEGPDEVNAVADFNPALRTADFFRTYFELANDGELDAQGRPSALRTALLGPRFGDEIRLTKPPWWLQRAAFALLGPLARLRGY